MSTLNARANQAYYELAHEEEKNGGMLLFDSEKDAFEEGWEKGYQAAAIERLGEMRGLLAILRSGEVAPQRQNAYDRAITAVEDLS